MVCLTVALAGRGHVRRVAEDKRQRLLTLFDRLLLIIYLLIYLLCLFFASLRLVDGFVPFFLLLLKSEPVFVFSEYFE
jgi:hypothetical protein